MLLKVAKAISRLPDQGGGSERQASMKTPGCPEGDLSVIAWIVLSDVAEGRESDSYIGCSTTVASALRGGRGSQPQGGSPGVQAEPVASALRGGRGSQHYRSQPVGNPGQAWRPPSGVDEDRNGWLVAGSWSPAPRGVRPPGWTRIATLDELLAGRVADPWRPPSGVDEDRNWIEVWYYYGIFTGGVRPPGWTRIATRWRRCPARRWTRGVRPPGWTRIATTIHRSR
jgi:hypothetical protein